MRIVILGGGYAGAACALRLGSSIRRHGLKANVTLVNPSRDFIERIRLHQAATGQRLRRRPLPELLSRAGVQFLSATATDIDLHSGTVRVTGKSLTWDRLVVAVGSTIASPCLPGAGTHALPLNSTQIGTINARLAALPSGGRVAIVGGGLTSIESAAEIKERFPHLQVTMLSRGELLPRWAPAASEYVRDYFHRHSIHLVSGVEVTQVWHDRLHTAAGDIRADLCLWTAGFSLPSLVSKAGLSIDDAGKARVDPQLRSVSDHRVHVVGDVAAPVIAPGHPLPMGCKSAMPTGVHAADNIVNELLERAPRHLDFATPFYCVSLGRREGLIQLPGELGTSSGRVVTHRSGAWIKEVICRGTSWALQLESRNIRAVQWMKTGNAPDRIEPAADDGIRCV